MNALITQLSSLAPGQLDAAKELVQLLKDGGPWALVALLLLAVIWLAKSYVSARDERDKAVSDLNDKLTGLLKDMVLAIEGLKKSVETVETSLDRIERKLENAPTKQG